MAELCALDYVSKLLSTVLAQKGIADVLVTLCDCEAAITAVLQSGGGASPLIAQEMGGRGRSGMAQRMVELHWLPSHGKSSSRRCPFLCVQPDVQRRWNELAR